MEPKKSEPREAPGRIARRCQRALWFSFACVYALLCWVPRESLAADEPALSIDVEAGLGGVWRPGTWTPIRILLANTGPDWRGNLTATPRGVGALGPRYMREVEVPRGSRMAFWLYVRLAESNNSVEVAVVGGGRSANAKAVLLSQPLGRTIAVLGVRGSAGLGTVAFGLLAEAGEPAPTLGFVSAERAPDRWIGYEGVDVVLVQADAPGLFAGEKQAAAFEQWVRAGGRAVVVAPRGRGPLQGTVLAEMLPAGLGALRRLETSRGLAAFAGSDEPPGQPYSATSVEALSRRVLVREDGLPVVLHGPCGVGEVILFAFDPFAPPFDRWEGMRAVWRRVLKGDGLREPSPSVAVIGRGKGQARDLEALTEEGARVVCFGVADAPTDTEAYDEFDWVVESWTHRVELTPAQRRPLTELVMRDGRVVMVGPFAENFGALIGSAPGREPSIALLHSEAVASFAGVPSPAVGKFPAFGASLPWGARVLVSQDEVPLVVKSRQFSWVRFDPWAAPFATWPGRGAFWSRLYAEHLATPSCRSATWGQLAQSAESVAIFGRVRFGRLRVILLVYALVLGPGAWLLVRRCRRPAWVWGFLLASSAGFGWTAYIYGMDGREQLLALPQVSIVDLDGNDGGGSARIHGILYSPWAGEFRVRGEVPDCHVTACGPIPGEGLEWLTEAEGACDHEEGGDARVSRVELQSGTTQAVEARWRFAAGSDFDVRASMGPEGLTVDNRSKGPLENVALARGGWIWNSLGTVPPRETRTLPLGHGRKYFLREYQDYGFSYHQLLRGRWDDQVPWVAVLLREASVGPDGELARWLRSGGSVVLATTPRSPCRLVVDGQSPAVRELCLVRVRFE
ncbi:MAG: hypothetical protein HYZ53_11580 [Planctomycetes bacterium]|nr:hypothetical protein [Planctomycetota bacterium]